MKQMTKKGYYVILGITFLLFLCMGFIVGMNHEPWADEAQAWLIAKDNNSIMGIVNAVKYEGTPSLWHLIIKISQICGLTYDYFFILPLAFSAVGVLLLFRTKAPWYWKVLIPFTFFVGYQNSVVARSYSMVFPIMMLLTLFFDKRKEKPLGFYLSLVLLSLTSSFGIIVAGSFLLYDFISLLRVFVQKEFEKDGKWIYFFFAAGILIFLIGVMILPPNDCMPMIGGKHCSLLEIFEITTSTFFFSINNVILYIVVSMLLVGLFLYYCKKHIIQVFIYTIPLMLYYILVINHIWHLTYLYFLVIMLLIVFRENGREKTLIFNECVISSLLCLQCVCGFFSAYSDVRQVYSGSAEAYKFVEKHLEAGETVSAIDYYGTALQPYFEENIFENRPEKKRYYVWSVNNHCIDEYRYDKEQLKELIDSDLIISRYQNIKVKFDGYEKHVFKGKMFYKFKYYDNTSLIVWVKK